MLSKIIEKLVLVFLLLWIVGTSANRRSKHENESHSEEDVSKRKGKFCKILFANGPCQGSGNQNGTCYTEQECESRGGQNAGSCASGFGVCCIISISCGQMSSENCTYFDSSDIADVENGCCVAEICPCGDHICQLRLDFNAFMISGPSTNILSVAKRRPNGGDITVKAAADANAVSVTEFGQCLTDTFSVSNPDGPNPPTICGTNTGEHMYVEASECCNKLSFTLGVTANGVPAVATRQWSIKVTQYSCKFNNLAPEGCTQWFFDGANNNVQTYNYNNGNGVHLASQDQVICVRRERNNCRICWTTVQNTDFAVSGGAINFQAFSPNLCCSYAAATIATKGKGFDCIQIPLVQTKTNNVPENSVMCGANLGLKAGTACSTRTPFQLHFRSDKWETVPEAAQGGQAKNNGFTLFYAMDAQGCNPAGITG